MINKYQYTTQIERENILNSNLQLFLIEEQNIKEGNFLIFTDIEPIETTVSKLNQQVNDLNLAMAALIGGAI